MRLFSVSLTYPIFSFEVFCFHHSPVLGFAQVLPELYRSPCCWSAGPAGHCGESPVSPSLGAAFGNSCCQLGQSGQPALPWGFCGLGEQKESQHLEKIPMTKCLSENVPMPFKPCPLLGRNHLVKNDSNPWVCIITG